MVSQDGKEAGAGIDGEAGVESVGGAGARMQGGKGVRAGKDGKTMDVTDGGTIVGRNSGIGAGKGTETGAGTEKRTGAGVEAPVTLFQSPPEKRTDLPNLQNHQTGIPRRAEAGKRMQEKRMNEADSEPKKRWQRRRKRGGSPLAQAQNQSPKKLVNQFLQRTRSQRRWPQFSQSRSSTLSPQKSSRRRLWGTTTLWRSSRQS